MSDPSHSLVMAKGEPKQNPWTANDSTDTGKGNLQHQTGQVVQNLPTCLAEDIILQNLLKPSFPEKIDLSKYENVMPLQVNYGGVEMGPSNGQAGVNTPKGKIEYDKDKGFVSSCWASFQTEGKNDNEAVFTNKKEGVFIKHLATTVLNPSDLSKGVPVANLESQSFSFTSPNLASNNWSNMFLYQPMESVYKYDSAKGQYVPHDSKDGKAG